MSSADMARMLVCVWMLKCGFTASAAGSGWYRLYNNRGRENPHISAQHTHKHTQRDKQMYTYRPAGLIWLLNNCIMCVCVSRPGESLGPKTAPEL